MKQEHSSPHRHRALLDLTQLTDPLNTEYIFRGALFFKHMDPTQTFHTLYEELLDAYTNTRYEFIEEHTRYLLQRKWCRSTFVRAYLMHALSLASYHLGKPAAHYSQHALKLCTQAMKGVSCPFVLKRLQAYRALRFALVLHLTLGKHYHDARKELDTLIAHAQNSKNTLDIVCARTLKSSVLFRTNKHTGSLRELEQCLHILQGVERKDAKHMTYYVYLIMAQQYLIRQDFTQGYKSLTKAQALGSTASLHILLGYYHEAQSKHYSAYREFLLAIQYISTTHKSILIPSNAESFLNTSGYATVYLQGIYYALLLREQDPLLLLESYRRQPHNNAPKILQHTFHHQRIQLEQRIRKHSLRHRTKPKLLSLYKRLYSCDERIFTGKHLEHIPHSPPPSCQLIQSKLQNTQALVGYFYHKDKCFITLIQRQRYKVFGKTIQEKDFEKLIQKYLSRMQQESSVPYCRIAEKHYHLQLYELLVSQVQPYLKQTQELILVPFKILHSFPLHCLFFEAYPDLELSYVPSFQSVLHLHAQKLENAKALILGDPHNDLPGAYSEALTITRLFKSPLLLTGSEITRRTIQKALKHYPILHYSGHILYNNKEPLYSSIELAPKDYDTERSPFRREKSLLYLKDLHTLDLRGVKFVSLSGCSSGVEKRYVGERAIGFVSSFLSAGVGAVLASLWDIEDNSSKEFCAQFFKKTFSHQGSIKKGFQNTYNLMRLKHKHPFFYGAFVLYEGF